MRLAKLLCVLLALLLPVCALAEQGDNLLVNAGFETVDDRQLPSGWYTDAYVNQVGYTTWEMSDDARTGQHSAKLTNFGDNDARYAQRVAVEPDSYYCFSGYVKVLEMTDYGRGANLSIEGLYVFSDSLHDVTNGWKYLELYGKTGPEQTSVTVFARVGGYSGESIGSALFDDLSLRKVEVVPGNAEAENWYKQSAAQAQTEANAGATEEKEASPFWPWLIVISLAYLLMSAWMIGWLQREPRKQGKSRNRTPAFLIVGMLVAAAVRVAVALMVTGYPVDVNCFVSWGNTMTKVGPAAFYQTTSFCDYVPGYLYVIGLNNLVAKLLDGAVQTVFVHKLIPIACDLAMAWLLYRFASKRLDRVQAGLLGLLFAANSAMALNSSAWCQIDSVLCLCLMIVAWLTLEKKWAAVLPVYVLAALIKPQALMLGPLGLIAIIVELVRESRGQDRKALSRSVRSLLIGLGISAVVAAVIVIPFCFQQERWTWLFEIYGETLASYPYATVNTANLFYLMDANWVSITAVCTWQVLTFFLILSALWCAWLCYKQRGMRFGWAEPLLTGLAALAYLVMLILRVTELVTITWLHAGVLSMVMAFALVLCCYVRSGKLENLPLCGAVLFILLYVLGIKMHERYLFPALILLGMAYVLRRDIRVLGLMAVMSCTMLVNEGIVLDNALRLGSSMGHLNNDTMALNDLTSFINIIAALAAMYTCHGICVCGEEQRLKLPFFSHEKGPRDEADLIHDPKLHWKRIDWILMLSVTAVYSVVALTTLGSTKAPQNPWKSTTYDEAVVIDLGQHYDEVYMLYFSQVSKMDFTVAVSDDDENWSEEYWAEMAEGQCFRWKYMANCTGESVDAQGKVVHTFSSVKNLNGAKQLSGRYMRITAHQIGLVLNEVIFRQADGSTIPATVLRAEHANPASPNYSDPAALLDEQDTLEGEPSWWNGTYFDEVYHARTAFEHLHAMAPYENSHPPLGKVIMSWCVGIFGMTPFGWRFAGTIAGILMLPAMYVLGKQMTKRTSIGFAAMAMMTLDCMHFTQTRIATIDSFPVLFIILSWLFMLRFIQHDISGEPMKKLLPDLGLSGFFMGCGIASKWIGIYSGAGLALVYFWICLRHIRLRGKTAFKRIVFLCLWCLLFFVAIPLAIYLLSYVPYFAYAHVESLSDFLKRVYDANFMPTYGMLAYHSKPGRGMDHPFYTPWYDWPLIKKPMYYASPSFVPEGWSFALWCFGNPAVWLVGLVGVAAVAIVWFVRHFYMVGRKGVCMHWTSRTWDIIPAFILMGLLAQFLPWSLVPRGTYIYHYFASVPFLIIATSMLLHWIQTRFPKAGRAILIAYLAVCLVFFIAYFPYASGLLTPTWWLDYMKQFLRIYY